MVQGNIVRAIILARPNYDVFEKKSGCRKIMPTEKPEITCNEQDMSQNLTDDGNSDTVSRNDVLAETGLSCRYYSLSKIITW